jgi:transposase
MIPGGVRIFVCTAPVDLRHGFDRLAQTARERVGTDPMSGGALFVFANKRATRLKVLWFEKNGMCLLYTRLASGAIRAAVCGRRLGVGTRRCSGSREATGRRAERRSAAEKNLARAHALLDSDRRILHS